MIYFSPSNEMPAVKKYNTKEVDSSWLLEVASNTLLTTPCLFFFVVTN